MKTHKLFAAACLTSAMCLAPVLGQAALLGLTPSEPLVDFGAGGMIDYDATTGVVTISGTPATLFQTDPFLYGEVMGTSSDDERLITVSFHVGPAGNFVSGVDGPDLIVQGSIDVDFDAVADYDGVLLEAEATAFGFENGAGGGDDVFDVRFNSVGGLLAPLYAGRDLALRVVSEVSEEFDIPFSDSFAGAFTGQAKGVLGATDPVVVASCELNMDAYCSVNGGPNKSKCRIKVTKSPKHWEHKEVSYHGKTWRRACYGLHGSSMPTWATRYSPTPVKFTYVITNTGSTTTGNMQVLDAFDTTVSGIPAALAPGASVTLTRTENLYEDMENTVTVMGEYLSAMCADKDIVIIKDKLRDRRRHDMDDFKDKGRGDHH